VAEHATFKVARACIAQKSLEICERCRLKTFSLRIRRFVAEGRTVNLSFPMNVVTTAGSGARGETYYSIVIPVYNEEDVVGDLLDELSMFVSTWRSDYEILMIDDGSSDHTAEIIGRRFENWSQGQLVRLSRNCGQAAALYYGMKRACGQVVILMDGDGQNDPRDIPKVLAPLDEVDMVVGVRVERRDSFVRRTMSRLANAARSRILRDGVADSGCGIKAFHRRVIDAFIPMRTLYSFMPALAISAGFTVRQVPVHHRPRSGGKSKYGVRQFLWKPLLDLMGVWWFSRRRCPLAVEKAIR
jgi:dolichol-phosphate mannosyltransferase